MSITSINSPVLTLLTVWSWTGAVHGSVISSPHFYIKMFRGHNAGICKLCPTSGFVCVVLQPLWLWVACTGWIMSRERGFGFHWATAAIQSLKCLNTQQGHLWTHSFTHLRVCEPKRLGLSNPKPFCPIRHIHIFPSQKQRYVKSLNWRDILFKSLLFSLTNCFSFYIQTAEFNLFRHKIISWWHFFNWYKYLTY